MSGVATRRLRAATNRATLTLHLDGRRSPSARAAPTAATLGELRRAGPTARAGEPASRGRAGRRHRDLVCAATRRICSRAAGGRARATVCPQARLGARPSSATWSSAATLAQNPADLVAAPASADAACRASCPRRGRAAARPDPGPHPARAARPGAVRARLLVRPALRGDREPRPRLGRLRRRAACGSSARARRRASCRSASRPSGRSSATWSAARPALARRRARAGAVPRRKTRPPALALRRPPAPAAWVREAASPAGVSPARPATLVSPPTCSRAAPTCARSRSCSATRASRRPRSTLG